VPEVNENLLTPSQAATRVKCHPATVYRWIRSGKLPAFSRAGTRYLVNLADVEALLAPVRVKRPRVRESKRGLKLRELRDREVLRAAGLES
jgi:excisionase family DNA binding protein